jgi:peptidoglycan-N-acetylglucosamine deacetylase
VPEDPGTPIAPHPGGVARQVHLTFDAEHPNRPHHRRDGAEAILAVLSELSVKATFFLQGRWASANPEIAQRILAAGHTIGSHSNAHVVMTRLSDEGLAAEVTDAQQRIQEATGADPRPYFRCPYGEGHDDPRVVGILAALGYRPVGWDIDPQDWNEQRSKTELVDSVDAALAGRPSSPQVVLLHTWPVWTAEVVRDLVQQNRGELTWSPLDRSTCP